MSDASFSLVAIFLVVAYTAPIVLVVGLIFLGLPRHNALGRRMLRGGAAGAVAGAIASLVIGLLQHHGATGRGVLAAACFGFAAAGLAIALLHARPRAGAA